MRRWVLVGAVLAVALGRPGGTLAENPATGRRGRGTLRVYGSVEARTAGGDWKKVANGALLDGTELRTPSEGRAALELANGDVVAVGGSTSLTVGGEETSRLRLETGRVAVRFQPTS